MTGCLGFVVVVVVVDVDVDVVVVVFKNICNVFIDAIDTLLINKNPARVESSWPFPIIKGYLNTSILVQDVVQISMAYLWVLKVLSFSLKEPQELQRLQYKLPLQTWKKYKKKQ